ncbi:MAG: DUF3592 domain-containing protein [Myxococcota bacterium]
MSRLRLRMGKRKASNEPMGFGAKLVGTLFFGFFFAMGAVFTWLLGQELLKSADTYQWQERRCEILHSEVSRDGGEDPYVPVVRYRTLDAGPELQGQQLRRDDPTFGDYGSAANQLAPYPAGATVACFASSEGDLVLQRGPLWMAAFLLLPLIFVAIGGIGIVAMWRRDATDAQGRPLPEDLGRHAKKTGTGRGLIGMGVLFAAVGALAGWFLAFQPLLQILDAQRWNAHRCIVEHSSVRSHSSDDGTTYSVDILYRWDRGRGEERSSRHGFFGGSSSGIEGKREIVRAHPVGAEVDCWIHPERSNEAVLERGLTAHAWLAVIPLVFFGVGALLIHQGRRRLAKAESLGMLSGTAPSETRDAHDAVLPEHDPRSGSAPLAPESSRGMRLAGIVFAALFWNGIMSFFVYQAWQEYARGRTDWFLILFLVPFVLVGIGLVFGIGYGILALRNPKPELVASQPTPRLGDALDLQWRFHGNAQRLQQVRIVLRGEERATYTVGTNTHTATETFMERVLADLPAPACGMGGHVRVEIPATSMHSFEAEHNAVVWSLAVEGDIRRWPDVSEKYPIVVLPRRAEG